MHLHGKSLDRQNDQNLAHDGHTAEESHPHQEKDILHHQTDKTSGQSQKIDEEKSWSHFTENQKRLSHLADELS